MRACVWVCEFVCAFEREWARRDRVFGAKIDDQQHNKLQFHTCDWHKNDSRKWTLSRTFKDPKQYIYVYIVILETIFTVLYHKFLVVLELLIPLHCWCYWCCCYFLCCCCCFTAAHSQIFTQWRCRAETKVESKKKHIHIRMGWKARKMYKTNIIIPNEKKMWDRR